MSMAEIVEAQAGDPEIQAAIARVLEQLPLTGRYAAVGSQLEVSDGVLFRSVKLPVEGTVRVPVIAESLVDVVVGRAHDSSGHANWQTMYKVIRSRAYFPGIASAYHDFVKLCLRSSAAELTFLALRALAMILLHNALSAKLQVPRESTPLR